MCFIMNDKQDWKDALQKDRDDSVSVIFNNNNKLKFFASYYEHHERHLAAIQESYF